MRIQKKAIPFFLGDEYEQIEKMDYKNNLKSYKKWLKLTMLLFILTLLIFIFDNQLESFYYQSVFLIYIIVIGNWKIVKRQLLSEQILKILFINYVIAFCFSCFPLYLSVFFEIITILVSIDISSDKPFILKRIEYLNFYKIIIMIIAIYASLIYKI